MNRRKLIAAGVVGALAGCLRRAEPPSSEELLETAVETRTRDVRDLEARRRTTVETAGEPDVRVERIYQQPPVKTRREVRESDVSGYPPGAVSVRNRTTTWEYDPTAEMVLKRHHPNRIVADRTRIVLEGLLDDYTLEYTGSEDIDGRSAHVVEASPKDDEVRVSINLTVGDEDYVLPLRELSDEEMADAELTRKIWIDDTHRYPIRERNVVTLDGEVYHDMDIRFEDLEINEGVDDDRFRFDPPDDADVIERGVEPAAVVDSHERAEPFVPYPIPAPSVPDDYELDRVAITEPDGTVTTLWYADREFPERELYVEVRESQRFREEVLEEIEFDGRTGYRREGRIDSVFWTCGGLSYEVSSPQFEAPILDIAASIDCP